MVEKVRAAHEFCSMAHRGLWSPTLDAMKLRQGWGTLGCGWFRKSEGGPPAWAILERSSPYREYLDYFGNARRLLPFEGVLPNIA